MPGQQKRDCERKDDREREKERKKAIRKRCVAGTEDFFVVSLSAAKRTVLLLTCHRLQRILKN